MKLKVLFAGACIAAIALISCEETSTIGANLMADNVEIKIDSTFTVTGHSEDIGPMRPKTSMQLIGNVKIPGFGSLSSSTVMQFLPATVLDTANFSYENVDSMGVKFRYLRGDFLGDSIVPMQLTLYKLNRQLPAGITSDFDPSGYYDPQPVGNLVYNNSTLGNDSLGAISYREIEVRLPQNWGPDIFRTFEQHPAYFESGKSFAQNVLPGIYAQTTFGQGRLTRISETIMTMYLTRYKESTDDDGKTTIDTVHVEHQYFMVTPEVENSNTLKLELDPALVAMKDAGEALLVSPGGYQTEFRFPAPEVLAAYKATGSKQTVINSLSLAIPADSIKNDYGIGPCTYVLMVLKKDRDAFFAGNKLPDNVTSFYTGYNSATNQYLFSGLRSYIMDLASRESISEEDYTFDLIPVQVTFEQSGTDTYYSSSQMVETSVLPYIESPTMARLKLDQAQIKFTYTLQSKK